MSLHVVILAAGQGKRMYSSLPKVLHPVGGMAMLGRVIATAKTLQPANIHVVVGHGAEQIKNHLNHEDVQWVTQSEQLGTGHAVAQALPFIPADAHILVLSGDVPLIAAETLQALVHQVQSHPEAQLGLLVADFDDPTGLGRIIRDSNNDISAIVEEKDANNEERAIREIYSGICCSTSNGMQRWMPQLANNNAQGEYYLTDIIKMAVAEGTPVLSHCVNDAMEIQGVNNRQQLHMLERVWQLRLANKLLLAGTSLADAARIDIRGTLSCDMDVFIDVNCVFNGEVHLGAGAYIGPNCTLNNVQIGANCVIHPNSVLDGAILGEGCHIGPFARLRPGTRLGAYCKIGNFVETKNAHFGNKSKASHLSYLGDASIGNEVNIGAGTITCNYDGVNKHQTIIEDGVFVGSGTEIVAPITLAKNATIGAGTTLRKNAAAEALTLTEARQITLSSWKRPVKK